MKKIKLLTSLAGLASLTAITLPLAGCSCTNTNDPTVHTVESIEVYSSATKTEFKVGDTFNSKGLILLCKEEDGSRWQQDRDFTTDFDNVTFTDAYVGQQTVTVTYKNKTCTYKINIEEATPTSNWVMKPYDVGSGRYVYLVVDDEGIPKTDLSFESGKTYTVTIEYDSNKESVAGYNLMALDATTTTAKPIFSNASGEYSATTTASSGITITPFSDPESLNEGYKLDFDTNTTQTITVIFKTVASASGCSLGFNGH